MKILVTGSSGIIGKAVVEMLFNTGHTVIGVDTVASAPLTGNNYGIFVHYSVDIRDRSSMSAIFSRWLPDAVIHLAGVKVIKTLEDTRINENATIDLFNSLNPTCRTFVYANTSSKYTSVVQSHLDVCAESNIERFRKISAYATTKFTTEVVLRSYFTKTVGNVDGEIIHRPSVVSLNIFQLMAFCENDERSTYFEDIVEAYRQNKPFTVFTHKNIPFLRSYVSVRDVALAFALAARKNHGRGVYHDVDICADTPCSGVDIYLEFKLGRGVYSPNIIVNRDIEGFSPSFEEFNHDRLLNERTTPNLVGDNRAAKELLGWIPRDTVRDIINRIK